jgi:Leucine-rich repeat (LRR) protein
MVKTFNNKGEITVYVTPQNLDECVSYILENQIFKVALENVTEAMFPDLSFFKKLGISSLAINSSSLNLSKFPVLETLQELYLNDFQGLVICSAFPGLKFCAMDWEKKFRNPLRGCQLETLYIRSFSPPSFDLREIDEQRLLSHLHITQTSIITLRGVESLESLAQLEIHYAPKLIDIASVAALKKNLRALSLFNAKNIENLDVISGLTNLETLILNGLGDIPTIKFIRNLPNLTELRLYETNVVDGDMSPCLEIFDVGFTNRKHYTHKMKDMQ